ncbi:hypothetical protein MHMDBK_00450 [Mesomycoplasma hyorhinis]|uniref:Uncharacterized protein n=1 Tax=Mesomycoplasma hyorhinis (strain MCLD) TaxID=936139 RepID=A0ABM5M6K7_MESHM|nr:hypothetical protein SRH_04060 [Mesomycoplasma hyorhinis MCLD]AOD25392.1 hypothetical protein MHMDBK_00450 [Mesomycoplasma hyorhinis]
MKKWKEAKDYYTNQEDGEELLFSRIKDIFY